MYSLKTILLRFCFRIMGGVLRKGKGVVVPYGGRAVELENYQILCDTYCV